MVQEDDQLGLLGYRDLPRLGHGPLENLLEKLGEMLGSHLEWIPGGNSLTELLVDDHHDGHEVGQGRRLCGVVRPEKIFQKLRELQHHDSLDAEVALLDVIVDLLHHLDGERFVSLLSARRPVRLGQAGEVVALYLLHSRLRCPGLPELGLRGPGLQILVNVRAVGILQVRLLLTPALLRLRLHGPAVVAATTPSPTHDPSLGRSGLQTKEHL